MNNKVIGSKAGVASWRDSMVSWERHDIPQIIGNSLGCATCENHVGEALSYIMLKCGKARVTKAGSPPIIGPVSAKVRHYPCSKLGCKKPAVFNVSFGELTDEAKGSDHYALMWLMSRGFDVSSVKRSKLKTTMAVSAGVLKINLTESQAKLLEKALRQALDREKDEDKRYELAVLVDRLIPPEVDKRPRSESARASQGQSSRNSAVV